MQTRTIVRRTSALPNSRVAKPENKPLGRIWRIVGIALIIAFMIGGIFSGLLFYETVRSIVAAIPQPKVAELPGGPVASRSNTANTSNAPSGNNPLPFIPSSVQPQAQQPQQSLGGNRINFLLLGVDLRPGETGPARTDTMIVVTVDPTTKSVGMLSIPRDLWVPIPGYGEDRINTAYFTGDARKYPGGGPALAEKTIQYNFGVQINYYIVINFVGFRKLVDALGGLTIDVPKDLDDPSFPDDTYGYLPLHITKGVHHFNGDEALQYARSRHQDSDFGRMRRQQQVLKAIKDQALQLDILTKIPALWAAKDDAVKTDLTIDKVIALVNLAKDVKADAIQSVVIDERMALGITTPQGAQVLWPDREKIRAAIEPLFNNTDAAPAEPTAAPQAQTQPQATPPQVMEQLQKLAAENARIEISNGTANDGLSDRVAKWLKSEGFNVVLVDNAERTDYEQTVIIESNNRPYTKGLLLTIFGVSQVRQNPNAKTDLDLRIIIGKDFNEKQIPDSR